MLGYILTVLFFYGIKVNSSSTGGETSTCKKKERREAPAVEEIHSKGVPIEQVYNKSAFQHRSFFLSVSSAWMTPPPAADSDQSGLLWSLSRVEAVRDGGAGVRQTEGQGDKRPPREQPDRREKANI